MRVYFIIVACFFYSSLSAQDYTEVSVENSCNCDILISSEEWLDPSLPPTHMELSDDGRIVGDLDEFVKYFDGKCHSTVRVLKRKIVDNEVIYKRINTVTNFNDILQAYDMYNTFCFDGEFYFKDGIKVTDNKIIRLLSGTVLNYQGNSNDPAITFLNRDSGIEGGTITTLEPMKDGLIKIKSESARNATSIQIKDINLVSYNAIPYEGAHARNDRGIHMDNPFESLMSQRDFSTNYFAKIQNVTIEGFAVGIHARGWTNVLSVSNINFKNIKNYGLWVSGCVDNAFTGLNYENCPNAYGIRIDNSIDERYRGTMVGGQNVSVPDPNERVEFKTEEIIWDLSSAADQSTFNANLNGLLNINGNDDVTFYMALLDACEDATMRIDEDINFLNSESGNQLKSFGLKGYKVDDERDPLYDNYMPDAVELSEDNEELLTKRSDRGVNIFVKDFEHEISLNNPNIDPIEISLEEATCIESAGHTMFFNRPSFNSFSNINYLINGVAQIKSVLELRGREDDLQLNMERVGEGNGAASPCEYEEHRVHRGKGIELRNAVGFGNVINLCELPADPNFKICTNRFTEDPDQCKDQIADAIIIKIKN